MDSSSQISVIQTARRWWAQAASCEGSVRATQRLLRVLWEFIRDSTPGRLRSRFGDADYDWDHRVNTTSGAVGWRDRLLGQFHSEYQPTEPTAFHEMLDFFHVQSRLNLCDFSFIDLGSGKGRTLLMASDFPFRKIIGVELLPALHQIAVENLGKYKNDSQQCFVIESICADATAFHFPEEPLVLYLFNSLPEPALRQVIANLEWSLQAQRRRVYILYHNPLLDHVLGESPMLKIFGRTDHCSFWRNV